MHFKHLGTSTAPTQAQDHQHGSGQPLPTPRNINCRVLKNFRMMLKLTNRTRQLFQPTHAQDQHGSERESRLRRSRKHFVHLETSTAES
ncbi:hypothetical protein PBY51_011836 [Eleginops maclovinus]|uniref:Uncharacterized protein n=1 Tax=Eleginops maclovinus TaxID=56733 RepID=A0AAN7XPG0_ELEMC|nr:hypothetical protein PBY51_011836 [Eleginops maclovinus]